MQQMPMGLLRPAMGLTQKIIICLALAGCMGRGVEVPDNDAAGSDVMKKSPCACAQIEWKGAGYEWIG